MGKETRMIDEKSIENIRKYGIAVGTGERKRQILVDEVGFPIGKKAENVIIMGCFQAEGMPHVFHALKNLLDHFKMDYTLLDKEHCCGWMTIGQPAVIAKNEEDIARFKEISREFIVENFRQAKELGAKSIVLFCGACEPNYTNYKDLTDLEVIPYHELIDRYFKSGKLERKIDYYPGCYRFRRRITDKPVDVEPAVRILKKIKGLEVNYIDSTLCCNIPPHMDQIVNSIKSDAVVNICTGCYYSLNVKLGGKPGLEVKMLPEIVWEAVKDK
jgi:Fe-S oxidoreductase